jgi:hypothetical protein
MPDPKQKIFDPLEDVNGLMSAGTSILGDTVAAVSNTGTNSMKDTAKGKAIGGTLGAAAGSVIPIVGTAIGQQVGSMIGGLIGGKSDRKRMEQNNVERMQGMNDRLNYDPNVDPYGYMEDGGVVAGADLQGLPGSDEIDYQSPVMINIERGELMVAGDGKILTHFENPNAYKPHAATAEEEHAGNFVVLPEGAVIIPKKNAKTYLDGDDITRRSIMMEVVKNQQNKASIQMAEGGVTGGGDPPASEYRDPYYESSAALAHYKELLNNKLKAKNPKAYDEYFNGMRTAISAPDVKNPMDARRKYVQSAAYNDYLTPDEVRQTLGEDYDKYIDSVRSVNKYHVTQGLEPLYGNIEGEGDLPTLNYGRRFASLQVTPRVTNTIKGADGTARSYTRNYTYNPETRTADYTEEGDLTARPTYLRPKQTVAKMAYGGVAGGPGKGKHQKIGHLLPDLDTVTMSEAQDPLNIGGTMNIDTAIDNLHWVNTPDVPARTGVPANLGITDIGSSDDFAPQDPNAIVNTEDALKAGGGSRGRGARDVGALAKRVGAFLPGAMQASMALQSDPNLRPVFNQGYDSAEGYINQMPSRIGVEDQLAEVEQSLAAGLDAISKANTPSARAEAQNMVAQAAKIKGDIVAQGNRLNIQMANDKLGRLAQNTVAEGSNNQAVLQNFQNEQRMDSAARRNVLANAASEGYTNMALMENEDTAVEMINAMSRFVNLDPLAKQKIIEDPEARTYISNYIQERMNAGVDVAVAAEEAFRNIDPKTGKPRTTTITSQTQKRGPYGQPAGSQTKNTVITR